MSLLDEIRSDLVNESANLANTLRKAKILASSIRLPEFREWVDSELSGYSDMEKVPNYRCLRPNNLGNFFGPGHSSLRNVPLPTYNLPDSIKDFAENQVFYEGVGQLEAMAAQASESYQLTWPPEIVIVARDAIQMSGGMVLTEAYQPISPQSISGILDQVKTKLLDFVLGLQESNITSEDLDNRTVEPGTVRNLFNISIHGDHNIVAGGEHVNQQANPVEKGDIDSLLNHLREMEVDNGDLSDLETAVSAEPDAPERRYGPNVQAWLGAMISKAASSTWRVGVETGSKILTDALNRYYGY